MTSARSTELTLDSPRGLTGALTSPEVIATVASPCALHKIEARRAVQKTENGTKAGFAPGHSFPPFQTGSWLFETALTVSQREVDHRGLPDLDHDVGPRLRLITGGGHRDNRRGRCWRRGDQICLVRAVGFAGGVDGVVDKNRRAGDRLARGRRDGALDGSVLAWRSGRVPARGKQERGGGHRGYE